MLDLAPVCPELPLRPRHSLQEAKSPAPMIG
jgi:hypothetical protein